MKNLYFIKIKEDYMEYLKKFDSKIQDNSNLKNNKPYIGILIESNDGQKYFAPISSPKEKHLKRSCNFKLLEEKAKEFDMNNI